MIDFEISIVTFKYDIPNTYLQFITLGKNLTTKTKIQVYYNYENLNDEESEIRLVKRYIKVFLKSHDVTLHLKSSIIKNSGAWISQQKIKWYSAYVSTAKYQLVLDSKNFLFRPLSLDNISTEYPPAFGKDITDEWTRETIDHCRNFIFEKTGTNRRGPSIDAITPWIWDTEKVKEMLDTLWPNMSWCELHEDEFLVSEWLLYITWIEHSINYDENNHLTIGMWGEVDNDVLIKFADQFRKNTRYKFWTHHRMKNDPQHFKITKRLIKENNICSKNQYETWLALRIKYNSNFSSQ